VKDFHVPERRKLQSHRCENLKIKLEAFEETLCITPL